MTIDTNPRRALDFGIQRANSRSSGFLVPLPNGRSLLNAQSLEMKSYAKEPAYKSEPFTDEKEAMDELGGDVSLDLGGEGFFDTARNIAGKVGRLATGKVGTTVSNVLSKKFNKNPNWRSGFPGEAHLVLPTKYGLTRANWCGPGTNLQARKARGDKGVSPIDNACETHDTLYNQARSEKDLRKADNRLIRDIRRSKAGRKQKAVLIAGLRAKTLGEDVGLFGPETFTKVEGLHQKGRGDFHLNGMRRSLSNIPAIHSLRQSRFIQDSPRDISSILNRRYSSGLTQAQRMGSNGIISIDNAGKLKRREQVFNTGENPLSDPTISNNLSGSGIEDPTFQRKWNRSSPYHLSPTQAIDHSVRKAIDPTIGNMTGTGFLGDLIKSTISSGKLNKPADQLRKQVLKKLKKESKKTKLGRTAYKAGEFAVPKLIDLLKKQMKKKGLFGKGNQQSGGFLGMLASLAASFIVPEIIKAVSGRGIQAGSGDGKKIIHEVSRLHGITPKNLGMSANQVHKLIAGAIRASSGKGNVQEGGFLGALAGIAGSILLPEIMKLFKG